MFEGNPYGSVAVEAVQELDRQLLALHLASPLKHRLRRILIWPGRYRLEVSLRVRRISEEAEPVFDAGTMTEACG